MKVRIVLIMLAMCASCTKVVAMSGPITSQVVSPGSIEYGTAFWYSASVSYVNGGVTFTFPTGLFLQTPIVQVSVLLNGAFSALTVVNPVITAVSATSVTVRVNSGTILSIGEAGTNSVTVFIWAIGTAN